MNNIALDTAMEIYFTLEGVNHGNRQCAEKFASDEEAVVYTAPRKGTHRRIINRGDRLTLEEEARDRLKKIEPLTMSIRITRNGGVVRTGNKGTWHPVWKRMDIRKERHSGKEICRRYVDDSTMEIPLPDYPDYEEEI